MTQPDIFAHETLISYLQAVFADKKMTRPNWSLGAWARQLKLGNTASLGRLLNGTRVPGDALGQVLVSHLRLAALETEYFHCLILAARYSDDRMLCEVLQRKRADLALIKVSTPLAEAPRRAQILSDARLVNLWGTAPLRKVNRLLAADDLEAIPIRDAALIGFYACDFHATELGRQSEFYLGIFSKKRSSDFAKAGFFYKFVFGGSPLFRAYRNIIWGLKAEAAEVAIDSGASALSITATQLEKPLASFEMGARATTPWHSDATVYSISNQPSRRHRYRCVTRGIGEERKFDARVDRWSLAPNSAIAAFIDAVEFQPTDWIFAREFSCEMYPPEEA